MAGTSEGMALGGGPVEQHDALEGVGQAAHPKEDPVESNHRQPKVS